MQSSKSCAAVGTVVTLSRQRRVRSARFPRQRWVRSARFPVLRLHSSVLPSWVRSARFPRQRWVRSARFPRQRWVRSARFPTQRWVRSARLARRSVQPRLAFCSGRSLPVCTTGEDRKRRVRATGKNCVTHGRAVRVLTRRASFDVALFGAVSPKSGIGKNDETPDNGRIIGISPAEEGASPWLWSPIRYRVSRGGLGRWD